VIDLKLLHNALILARYRNFARAAEALDMSQPALSRSIAGFEATLGAQLFKRTRTGVEPTAFGERLLARGHELLSQANELERELALMQGTEVDLLRIGAGIYAADICVGPTLARLASQYPNLRVEMNTSSWRTVLEEVLSGRLDFAVMETSVAEHHPRLRSESLPPHPAALYCRADHPLAKKIPRVIDEVFAYPLVGPKLPARAAHVF
jgi:DNA-binding transcriptional LysR family regulator